MISVLIRAITYATLFIGLLLVFLPAQLLAVTGIAPPERFGWLQVLGGIITIAGAALALWCILTFVFIGKGTPAPFDPPRRLVIRGPYRFVRNPMHIGAGLALAGAALFYQSVALLAYAVIFLLVANMFVVLYEEPTLRRTFGADYESYCHAVSRWLPHFRIRG